MKAPRLLEEQQSLPLDFLFPLIHEGNGNIEIRELNFKPVQWSPREIASLHQDLLFVKLQDLKDSRVSLENRLNVISWVFTDYVDGEQIPFTYQACCLCSSVDPEELRSLLKFEIKRDYPSLDLELEL